MMRSPPPPKLRRETLARLGAAVLALLFVVAQGVSLADRVMVEHAICPEHGEWIHVAHGHGSAPPLLSGETRRLQPRQAVLRGNPSAAERDEHDVCALSVLDAPFPGVPGRQSVALALAPGRVVPHDRHTRAASPLPLLSLAPKSSPPLSA